MPDHNANDQPTRLDDLQKVVGMAIRGYGGEVYGIALDKALALRDCSCDRCIGEAVVDAILAQKLLD